MKEIIKEITPEERRKYIYAWSEKKKRQLEVPLNQGIPYSDFKNGIHVENNIEKGDVVLSGKDRESVNISEFLPKGVTLVIGGYEAKYNEITKVMLSPLIIKEMDLLELLHEIGHAWYQTNGGNLKNKALSERSAWAWGLKKAQELRKQGLIDESFTNEKLMDYAKAHLYTFAQGSKIAKKSNSEQFLKRKLTKEDTWGI